MALFCYQKPIQESGFSSKGSATISRSKNSISNQSVFPDGLSSDTITGSTPLVSISLALTPTPTLTPIPASTPLISQDLFQQFIKAYLKKRRALFTPPKQKNTSKCPFKAQNSDFYYENSHIKCYYFCK